MKLIHSRDIYYIVKDILKCFDPKVINHGERTAFFLYRMLQCMDKYEMYEIAEFAMLATFHDIGAFKTNPYQDTLSYETRDWIPHSIYGYLYLLYLTPFKERGKILLYHHSDFNQIPKSDYEYLDIVHCLNVAEKMDIYSNILGKKFDYMMFQKQAGTKISPKALDIFYQAEKKYGLFEKVSTGEYKKELSELYEYLIFTNEEKHDFILGFMCCMGFRSEYTMFDMISCVNICRQIGEKMCLSQEESEILYYAALLHDAGMCAVPKEIIEAPRRLTDEEMEELRGHVEKLEGILHGRIDPEALDVISAHHERGDGSGYPRHLKDHQMNVLQKILQVADTITGLTSPRSYREPKTKEQIIAILKEEADKKRLNREVVYMAINLYDSIMESVRLRTEETLATYHKLQDNYKVTYDKTK